MRVLQGAVVNRIDAIAFEGSRDRSACLAKDRSLQCGRLLPTEAASQSVCPTQLLIDLDVERIYIVLEDRRRLEVATESRAWNIRKRHQCKQLQSGRAQPVRRNYVCHAIRHKWRSSRTVCSSRVWVIDRSGPTAQVSTPESRGGNRQKIELTGVAAISQEVAKEERPIFYDRAADGPAIVIIGRPRKFSRVIEIGPSRQSTHLVELIERPVELVRTRLQGHIGYSASRPAKLGRIVAGFHVHRRDRRGRRNIYL